MNTPSWDVAQYLVSEEVGELGGTDEAAWNVYVQRIVSSPVQVVVVRDEPSLSATFSIDGSMDPFERCLVRIVTRARTDNIAYQKCRELREILRMISRYWVTEVGEFPVKYCSCIPQTEIQPWIVDIEEGLAARTILFAVARQENT